MVARILDLLFIQILRAWAGRTDAEPNWLTPLRDGLPASDESHQSVT